MGFFFYFLLTLFLIGCALLCTFILIQESKTMGLGASFGGDAGSSLFGTSTADIVKKITAWLSAFFLIGAVILSLWTAHSFRIEMGTSSQDEAITE
ncbi:MAG: preprotein translocase subunit SecG [Chlamydiota bacterium]